MKVDNKKVIEALENLLKLANTGELSAVCVVGQFVTGESIYVTASAEEGFNATAMLGALGVLRVKLRRSCLEQLDKAEEVFEEVERRAREREKAI
jgi:hypothetical protein